LRLHRILEISRRPGLFATMDILNGSSEMMSRSAENKLGSVRARDKSDGRWKIWTAVEVAGTESSNLGIADRW
jgi:hypothetical protein